SYSMEHFRWGKPV
nr:RecName: Full=Melanotropin alpha; AltName: Full=Alpha-MSH [Equus caballus]P61281.1 RecName: Full=Melanotropin alpha; AltName: Full=Alpha-MSH [Camelus dromedarius]7F4D_M Chain M, alpha-melanocyte-stimulating hormone [synthetic construct]8INR_L Chain L, alpha-melanocyte-stimulating hormone [synthetic construct]prf//0511280A melanotropin alpha [Oncorhynchus sp.]prf//0512240A melanotropin,N,O-(Ac)2 [Bos taurus]prf//0702463A melanotropin,des-Ac [Homo sapiens]prf//1516329A alpha melanotropin [P